MTAFKVPPVLLWQTVFARGVRLPKKQLLPKVVETVAIVKAVDHSSNFQEGMRRGNLDENEYRYWCGRVDHRSTCASCRVCGMSVCTLDARKQHSKDMEVSCHHICDVICEVLKKEKYCVSCGAFTYQQRWGIPMCCEPCQTAFRFSTSNRWNVVHQRVRNLEAGVKIGHTTTR